MPARDVPVVVSVVALLLTACGGAADVAPGAAASPTDGWHEILADAVRIDAAVDVSLAGADFTGVDDAAPVAVGDVVRTDDAGFAEINYYDGSVTRLDIDTSLQIVALSDAPDAAQIVTRMDLGRTWHRVADDIPDRTYTVETNVATATVRGTAFIVDCPNADTCTFTVLDGTIEITPTGGDPILLTAPDALEVTAAGDTDDAVPVVGVGEDDWIARNDSFDIDAGFDPLTDPSSAEGSVALEDLAGRWVATTSDHRVAEAVGEWANARLILDAFPEIGVRSDQADGSTDGVTFRVADGAVDLECVDLACSILDPAARATPLRGVLVEEEGVIRPEHLYLQTCAVPLPSEVREMHTVTPNTIRYSDVFVMGDITGGCDEYLLVIYEVELTRFGPGEA